MTVIYAFAFLAVMATIYIKLYSLNQRTELPEGCEPIRSKCSSCNVSGCAVKPKEEF